MNKTSSHINYMPTNYAQNIIQYSLYVSMNKVAINYEFQSAICLRINF